MFSEHKMPPFTSVCLEHLDPGYTGHYSKKKKAEKDLKRSREELITLQELLYAEDKHTLLIILQAIDSGGKDGTIRHVMRGVNPQGCQVTSFKQPTPEELSHDYLWRVHKALPSRRMIGIFNRSYYEDVLVVRVHELVPREQWEKRYDQINQFEHYLTENGLTILKFFLYISKEEQKERFQARLGDPHKWWKFSLGDLEERKRWNDYVQAYEAMLSLTSTPWAPWYIIPANRKWYRNLAVANIIIQTLRDLDMSYPEPEEDLSGVVIPD